MNIIVKKIKEIAFPLFTGLFVISAHAQQIRSVGDFSGIKAGDAFNIVISQSETNTVNVDADEKALSQIKTEVKDGILNVNGEGNVRSTKPIVINIGVKSLNHLDVSGASDVKAMNQLICDKISVESSGAGDIHLDIKADEIKAQLSGAGDITLKGTTQILSANISGAGDLKAQGLEAEKATIKVSGAGNAKINVKQKLAADVSGAGSIIYKGNPVERDVTISGFGSVRESKSGEGDETASDTTKFKLGKKKFLIIGDNDETGEKDDFKRDSTKEYSGGFKNWQGFELGINGFLDYKNTLDIPAGADFLELNYARSFQFGINLFEKDFHIYKNYINIVTGLGFDFNHYAFADKITLNPDSSYLYATISPVKFNKNALNVSYIKVPLMLDFNTGKSSHKNFHLAAGVEFAYRIHSVTKQKFELNDNRYKTKLRDDYNLEPFRFSGILRIGYDNVSVFANYGLNRLFQKDKGPQVYPFTLGITINI